LAVAAGLAAVIGWAYWPALVAMFDKWSTDPQYSHGYLVPLFAAVLMYVRRKNLAAAECRPDWRGLLLVVLGAGLFVAGGYLYMDILAAGAVIPTLLGLALMVGGRAALRWSLPMVLFLGFMVPLPYFVETAVGRPLQAIATRGSTWLLQLSGLPAVAEGNTILLEQGRIAVVEACNGLSMLLTFAALTTGLAMVVDRPLLDKLLLVASTVPVALVVNMARITGNGLAIEWWGPEVAHKWFHDQGGWMMMPLALVLLGIELWVLRRLLVEPAATAMPVVGLPPTGAAKVPVKS
jgi:exosortase